MGQRQLRTLAGLASLLLVLTLIYLDLEQTSPGPLSATHAGASQLADAQGCERCHGRGWSASMASACADCHEEIESSLVHERGLHGTLAAHGAQVEGRDCGACHKEHRGAELALVTASSFERAGILEPQGYDHRALQFELGGRHLELGCEECHPNAEARLLQPGDHRFLGLEQRCDSCHDDPHGGRMVRACDQCHGQSDPFAELASFEHAPDFPLVGGHADLACSSCHQPGGAHAVEVVGSTAAPAARGCEACHESPHAPGFVAASTRDYSDAARQTCALCHTAGDLSFDAPSGAALSAAGDEWHAATGFALAPPHSALACSACHPDGASFEERFPGRRNDDCARCHEDVHAGQFETRSPSSNRVDEAHATCISCHTRTHFIPPRFGTAEHAAVGFLLEGGHANLRCTECHTQVPGEARLFRGTPRVCAACHADVHDGVFATAESRVLGERGEQREAGCARCHTTQSFRAVHDFEHLRWTAFALEGAHARAKCASCHPDSHDFGSQGRVFGRVREVFGEPPTACSTCHLDAHRGVFDTWSVSGEVQPADCAQCHTSGTFADVGSFEHSRWTGFSLTGAHQQASCASCHKESAAGSWSAGPGRALQTPRTLGLAPAVPATQCDACHTDYHAGAFDEAWLPARVDDRTGCARCHTTSTFATLRGDSGAAFDHGLWTSYELVGAHARAACESCHPRSSDATHPSSYKPPLGRARGRSCAQCHTDPHVGQFIVDGRNDCARCHDDRHSFSEVVFDHDRGSRFSLDEHHADLACSACHVPAQLVDGSTAVRYRPLGTECADCHKVEQRR